MAIRSGEKLGSAKDGGPLKLHLRSMTGAILVACFALSSGCGKGSSDTPATLQDGVLVDRSSGHTLYVFDRDLTAPIESKCVGQCPMVWLPYAPREGDKAAEDYVIFTRSDGSLQWAYRSRPLYLYSGDVKSGDKNGDGMNGIWHAAGLENAAGLKPTAELGQRTGEDSQ